MVASTLVNGLVPGYWDWAVKWELGVLATLERSTGDWGGNPEWSYPLQDSPYLRWE